MRRNQRWGHVSVAAIVFSAGLAAAGSASAQDSGGPSDVGGIVITAEKRAADPQTAPIAVTVFNEDALRRNNIDEIDDLEFATPSLTIATAGQANMMNMRGVGKFDAGGTATSAIATYRDGVGTVSGFFNHEPYYDIESVEVLRGPQGTYVGENAAGGAIFVNTRDPSLGDYNGYVRAGIGNYETRELEAAINIPLGDTLAMRLSGRHVDRDSFYDVYTDLAATMPHPNSPGDIDHNSLRFGLLWQPTQALEVLFKLDLHRLDHGGNVFSTVPGIPGAGPNINDNDLYTVGLNLLNPYALDRMSRGVLEVNYDFASGVQLRSTTGVQYINTHIRNDDDGSAVGDSSIFIRPIFRVYTTEATLISPEEQRLRWLVGGFLRREMLWFPDEEGFEIHFPGNATPAQVPFLKINWRTPRDTVAVYGQLAYDLTDDLEIVGGLRLQHYEMEQRVVTTLFGGPFPGGTSGIRDDGYEEDTVNYKIALNYEATPEHYFYAFVATGSTTGGNGVTLATPPARNSTFDTQRSTSFEAGWKGTLMEGRVLTQFGGFYTLINDYQANYAEVISVGPPLVTRGGFHNLEGDSKAYGLEFQLQANIENWGLDMNAAWIHSELADGLLTDPVTGIINVGGNRIPWTPEYTFNVGVEYNFQVFNGATLTPRITYSWIDEQTVHPVDRVIAGVPVDRIFAHEQVNAQLTLATDNWLVQAYVTNAFEEEYIQAHSGDTLSSPDAYANEPRRYGIRVTRSF